MRFRCLAVTVCAALAAAATATGAAAAPGELDRSFGVEGRAPFPASTLNQVAEDMAVGPEDELFTLQRSFDGCVPTCRASLIVGRFDPSGHSDPSFGTGGVSEPYALPGTFTFSSTASVAVTPSRQVVAAGVSDGNVSLVRFDGAGRLDQSFGSGGAVRVDFGGEELNPEVAVQPDGKIVLGVLSNRGAPLQHRFTVVARFLPDGALDPSFGAGSKDAGVPGTLAIQGRQFGRIGLARSGGIVLGLDRCCSNPPRFFVGRRGADGQRLRGFASGSPWRNFRMGTEARVQSVIALPRGRIFVTVRSGEATHALKLHPNGRPIRSYGRKGRIRIGTVDGNSVALLDAAGGLVVAGADHLDGGLEPPDAVGVAIRRLPSGELDRGWAGRFPSGIATGGRSTLPLNEPRAIGLQSGGRIVIFGQLVEGCVRSCPPPRTAMTRLHGGRAG